MGTNLIRCDKMCNKRNLHCDLLEHNVGSHYDRTERRWWGSWVERRD